MNEELERVRATVKENEKVILDMDNRLESIQTDLLMLVDCLVREREADHKMKMLKKIRTQIIVGERS